LVKKLIDTPNNSQLIKALKTVREKIGMKMRQMDTEDFYRKQQRDNPDMPMPSAPPADF